MTPATSDPDASEYVVRFSVWARVQHALMIVSFALLLVTGMPQKWPYLDASRWIVEHLGGIFLVRWLHRAAGVGFSVLVGVHLALVVGGLLTRRVKPTMMFSRQDFQDAFDYLRYCIGWIDRGPRFGRYDYRQKFEYWGLVFGACIMAISGFILFFPVWTSRVLPAELIPAAKAMHSNEALLALLIILVWHLAGVLLTFPIDTSIFTGRIRKDRMRHEHPLEYEERFGRQ
jgi:cytochrome b subunit of formate dehydrogenase